MRPDLNYPRATSPLVISEVAASAIGARFRNTGDSDGRIPSSAAFLASASGDDARSIWRLIASR